MHLAQRGVEECLDQRRASNQYAGTNSATDIDKPLKMKVHVLSVPRIERRNDRKPGPDDLACYVLCPQGTHRECHYVERGVKSHAERHTGGRVALKLPMKAGDSEVSYQRLL
jgi:hypothetical protein